MASNTLLKRLIILFLVVSITVVIGYLSAGLDFTSSPEIVTKQQATVSLAMAANIDSSKLYKVMDVIDGDTFKVKIDGKEITVRMLGINTPEVLDPRKSVECFGPEASAETKLLLNNREVKLALNPGREKTDIYNRLLAYAYRDDGLFINELLIQEGFAREYTVGKPYQYQSEFRNIEKEAKMAGKGLWSKCANVI
ncbi:MAG: thermonuclease family protein [Patescibacteria group bacterium]